jgi:hypothetical protein
VDRVVSLIFDELVVDARQGLTLEKALSGSANLLLLWDC